MKILYIDIMSYSGHIKYNAIQIKALSKIGEVCTIFKVGYADNFDKQLFTEYYNIPDSFYKWNEGTFKVRFMEYKILKHIRQHIRFKDWDKIILSCYESISLFFSSFKGENIILINHNNVSDLDNSIKSYFFKRLSNSFTHIVFNECIKKKLTDNFIQNVRIIPHGFFMESITNVESDFLEKLNLSNRFIFLPSSTSVDVEEVQNIIRNDYLLSFLKNFQISLVVKGNYFSTENSVVVINRFLSSSEYNYLFLNSLCILLPYSKCFTYRVSGVMFECMDNNKPCLCSEIPSLQYYSKYFNFDGFFDSVEELVEKIKSILRLNKGYSFYDNLDEIKDSYVGWSNLLK